MYSYIMRIFPFSPYLQAKTPFHFHFHLLLYTSNHNLTHDHFSTYRTNDFSFRLLWNLGTVTGYKGNRSKLIIPPPLAGTCQAKPFLECTESDLDKIQAINYQTPFLMTQAAVPHIPQGGRIIFLSTSLNTASALCRFTFLSSPPRCERGSKALI